MSRSYKIQYLRNHEIDRIKWDAGIDQASNGLIYGHSFYLDALCDNWDALVTEDYSVLMPLPWRKKWGFKYIYQPAFIQRLGLFGNTINDTLKKNFYDEAVKRFRLIHYNITAPFGTDTEVLHTNYIIDLRKDFTTIQKSYSTECLKNIRKAEQRGCELTTNISIEQVVQMYRTAYGHLHAPITAVAYKRFEHLLNKAKALKKATIIGVTDQSGEVIYSATILKDQKRFYYIMGAPTTAGREKRAAYFFIDRFFKGNADTPFLFDFEGSDIPNVSAFYQRFGPASEYYYEHKTNKLPNVIKWLKK